MLKIFKNLFGPSVDLKSIMKSGAIIVDVRTTNEYQQGHGKSSKNIPLSQIGNKVETIRKWKKPIITCCASGMRSASAAKMLKRQGIEAYNGGSWQKADALAR